MTEHKHRSVKDQQTMRGYSHPVAASIEEQDQRAHGNICYVDRCRCGATRMTNVNGQYSERGPWIATA